MTSDRFLDELVADVDGRAEDGASPAAASSPNADVDEWFEQAAAGRIVAPSDGNDASPAELLGAAMLPLDGDLVSPARERWLRLHRAEPSRPRGAATTAARRHPHRGLVLVALGALVFVVAVVVLMRPVAPVEPARPILARELNGPTSPAGEIGDAVHRATGAKRTQIARARAHRHAARARARRRASRRAAARQRRAAPRRRSARRRAAQRDGRAATPGRAGAVRQTTPSRPPAASPRRRYPTSEFDF